MAAANMGELTYKLKIDASQVRREIRKVKRSVTGYWIRLATLLLLAADFVLLAVIAFR